MASRPTKSRSTKPAARTPRKTTRAKTAPKPAKPAPQSEPPAKEVPVLRKGDLFTQVAERGNVKRRDAKAAIEAALEILGEAVVRGDDLALAPLGRVKVARTNEQENATVHVLRLRRPKAVAKGAAKSGVEPADQAE